MIPPKHMIVGLGGPSREDMLEYSSDLFIFTTTHKHMLARLGYPSRQDMLLYASSPPSFFFARKEIYRVHEKYKWPSKDARGPADHF